MIHEDALVTVHVSLCTKPVKHRKVKTGRMALIEKINSNAAFTFNFGSVHSVPRINPGEGGGHSL